MTARQRQTRRQLEVLGPTSPLLCSRLADAELADWSAIGPGVVATNSSGSVPRLPDCWENFT